MEYQLSFDQTPVSLLVFITTIGFGFYTLLSNQEMLHKMMLHPYSVFRENKWYQLITSGFVHADLIHLMFNMLSYYFFAFNLEMSIGSLNFFIIYFVSLVVSDISTIIKNKNNPAYYALGASGAVSAVIFASILVYPSSQIGIMFIPIGIPAPIFGILYLVYGYFASKRSGDLINHEAHFWGAVSGILLILILVPGILSYFINQVF
jgi:membrane associated rhomboid family serine protease